MNFRKVRRSKADGFLPDCYINAAADNPRRLERRSKGIFTTAFAFWRIGKSYCFKLFAAFKTQCDSCLREKVSRGGNDIVYFHQLVRLYLAAHLTKAAPMDTVRGVFFQRLFANRSVIKSKLPAR